MKLENEIRKIQSRINEINHLTRSLSNEKKQLNNQLKKLRQEYLEKLTEKFSREFQKLQSKFKDKQKTEDEFVKWLIQLDPELAEIENELFALVPSPKKPSIIFQHDKRSGITYAYENDCWWDEEKQQSRSQRKLIGRVDTDDYLNGVFIDMSRDEIIKHINPTGSRGRKRKNSDNS
jgi:DNA repair exonuclease SbcCD ATPase subunit